MSSKFQWSALKHEKLTEIASNTLMRSGCTCFFIPLSKTVGIKLYYNKRVRDHASDLQKLAHKHKLAPNSGAPFEFRCLDFYYDDNWNSKVGRRKFYGYLTQIAKMRRGSFSLNETSSLLRKLWYIGIDHHDLHGGNLGYVGGKLVCIDFDMISCQRVRGRRRNAG